MYLIDNIYIINFKVIIKGKNKNKNKGMKKKNNKK